MIADNLKAVTAAIDAAVAEAGGAAGSCRLIAVSKTQPAEAIEEALAAGHRLFGENRVQEAAAKWPALKARYPDAELHLIGGLQSNKVKEALALFDAIQSVDRPKLARAIARHAEELQVAPRLYIQVNTGEEPQKGGVLPAELAALVALVRDELGLPLVGLMSIPPQGEEPALHFALLKKLAARHGLPRLSMGMSGDYELAARMGASEVRVGTAVFGPRKSP